jgi:class 3 adenylate cyclase
MINSPCAEMAAGNHHDCQGHAATRCCTNVAGSSPNLGRRAPSEALDERPGSSTVMLEGPTLQRHPNVTRRLGRFTKGRTHCLPHGSSQKSQNCRVGTLPTGTVSFLMSDAEGSSALWRGAAVSADATFRHLDALVAGAVADADGVLVLARGEGDSHFAVFERASDAVIAAVSLQRAIVSTRWPHGTPVAVRVGVHTGEPLVRDDNYFGDVVNETARLRSLGHGGQILTSSISTALARYRLPGEITFRSLGTFRIRDFRRPQEVFQVTAPGLASEFDQLRALDSSPPPIAVVIRIGFPASAADLADVTYDKVIDDEDRFERFLRRSFDECGGYALTNEGAVVTAAFATPVSAVEFFAKVQAALRPHGHEINAGVHAGPVEITPRGPMGPSVVIAGNLRSVARPGEIVATRTIADLLPPNVRCQPRPGPHRRILGNTWELLTIEPGDNE